ncbi:MAG: YsnF/AvaK domain-containing protein [Armatimonadetes bacterium]|nr:YsnF/AvaK domain-containing protein [Armatimonadota bacterium]
MTTTQNAIAGYFADRASAERAVRDLIAAGFNENEIDLAPYRSAATGQYAGSQPYLESASYLNRTNADADYAAGHAGGYTVTVTGSRASESRAILERDGADISDRVNPALAQEGVQRIQLREEQLTARKQRVQAGEVRVHKDVVTETKTIDVPVTHEELVIERRPVTGQAASAAPIGQDTADIVVPLSREEATLEKQTVVREEVEVGKRSVTETERLSDTVRREEARIENTGDVRVENATDHRADMLDTDETVDRTGNRR